MTEKMPKEDLIKYIEEAKSRGVSDNAIRTTLLYAHWTKEEISDAFKKYDDTRQFYDPNKISAGIARVKLVNFTSDGRIAATLEKKSRRALIFVLVLLFGAAVAVFWYIGYINGSFVTVSAVPSGHILDDGTNSTVPASSSLNSPKL